MINKVRIPFHHIFYNWVLTGFYFLIAYIFQVVNGDQAVYLTSLNFNCNEDFSYFYSNNATSDDIMEIKNNFTNFRNESCLDRHPNKEMGLGCMPYYNYFCQTQSKKDQVKYDHYKNRDFFLWGVLVLNTASFIVSWIIHFYKTKNLKGYNAKVRYVEVQAKIRKDIKFGKTK